jgi:hypothetical protein
MPLNHALEEKKKKRRCRNLGIGLNQVYACNFCKLLNLEIKYVDHKFIDLFHFLPAPAHSPFCLFIIMAPIILDDRDSKRIKYAHESVRESSDDFVSSQEEFESDESEGKVVPVEQQFDAAPFKKKNSDHGGIFKTTSMLIARKHTKSLKFAAPRQYIQQMSFPF